MLSISSVEMEIAIFFCEEEIQTLRNGLYCRYLKCHWEEEIDSDPIVVETIVSLNLWIGNQMGTIIQ